MRKKQLKQGKSIKENPSQYQLLKKPVKRNKYSDLIGLSIMIFLGIIIYSNSFKCSFNFDDLNSIVNNTKIQNLFDVKAWWNYSPNRPISMLTFALNYHFNQLDVWYYHLVNLIIHLINACLVWWLCLLIFSSPALKDNPIIKHKKTLAFLTALLFVSHPLATQSVTYIVQRMSSMAAMFYLLSIALYVKARLSGKVNIYKYLLFAGSFISALLAILTKENAFTLPFAIILFEIFFLQTKKLSVNFKDYRVILIIATFLSLIIIIPLKFSLSIFDPISPSQGNTFIVTPVNYLFTQFSVIVKYIQLLFLPINQNLDYDFPISNNFFGIRTLLSLLLLLLLFVTAIFLFKRNRIISFGIFWFFLTLLIESSFIPINDLIYEHRTYLPSFGFFLILSSGIYVLLWKKYKYIAISLFVIIIASNSILTFERNKVWKDELTLWNDVVSKSPDKARPINNRGFIYLKLKQWNKAIADFSKAIEIYPKWAVTYYNRGVAYENLGQQDKAIDDYSKAISLDPKYTDAYYNRGNLYGNLRKMDKAINDFSKAIEFNPNYTDAYYNRGVSYEFIGQWEKSIDDFIKVIEIDPNNNKAYSNRGAAWSSLGQWDKAITDYSMAIEISPNFALTYNNRGNAYVNIGLWDKAIEDFSKAIEIDPNLTDAYKNRDIAYQKLKNAGKR